MLSAAQLEAAEPKAQLAEVCRQLEASEADAVRVEAESRKDLEGQSSTLGVEAANAAAQQKEEYKDALTAHRREVATHQQQLKEKAMPGDELTVAFEGKMQEVADLTEQLRAGCKGEAPCRARSPERSSEEP